MARVAIWLCLACGTVSCSGSTVSNPGGSSGAAGTATQTDAGSGNVGGAKGSAGSASSAGSPSAGSGGSAAAGTGGVSSAGSGGAELAGSGGTPVFTGDLRVTPAKGSVWELPSGDPLNSTPPVLARLGDGVVLAGATSDPKVAGVDAFGTGIESEAFLAGLDHAGKATWSHPLLAAGLPNAVAVNATQEIVVVAPYLPDLMTVSTSFSSDSIYLGKFTATGTTVFEKELAFDTGTRLYALAVDGAGAIWLAGAQSNKDDFPNESMMLAKYDSAGKEQFVHVFPHDGSTCYATSISATAAGEVVLTGTFNGHFNLGGDALTTQATYGSGDSLSLMPNGFAARFTSEGKHVWSQRFGGPIFDLGNAVTWLPDGDVALAGKLSGAASVGGKSVAAEEETGQPFVARLDGTGKARWVELSTTGAARAFAIEPDGSALHVAGSFDANAYLQDRDAATGMLLRSAKPASGTPDAYSAALDGVGSLWLAGTYPTSLDLSNQNLLSAASGVFLLRLDRAP
jgi:hypothetical protein